jgi:hypothetical protein
LSLGLAIEVVWSDWSAPKTVKLALEFIFLLVQKSD